MVLSNNLEKKKFVNLINHIREYSDIPLGFQISHAGRKGSSHVPWYKFNAPLTRKEGSWKTYAPSSIKRDTSWPKPFELDIKNINLIKRNDNNGGYNKMT